MQAINKLWVYSMNMATSIFKKCQKLPFCLACVAKMTEEIIPAYQTSQ